jgi:hypothetical protein
VAKGSGGGRDQGATGTAKGKTVRKSSSCSASGAVSTSKNQSQQAAEAAQQQQHELQDTQDVDSSLKDTSTGWAMAGNSGLQADAAVAANKVAAAGAAASRSGDDVDDDTVAVADASAVGTGLPDGALQLRGVASAAGKAVSTIDEDAVTSPVKGHIAA